MPVFDVGHHEGRPYIVYEFVAGETLSARLGNGTPIPPHQAIRWLVQLLDAIAAAHDHNVIHRDLNPRNIRIDTTGAARLLDFGIAAISGTRTTASEGIIGTANYLAPEQLSTGIIGPATDIFALGLTLYEMLVGKPAIEAESSLEAMYKIVHVPVDPPSTGKSGLDPRIDDIVLKALAKVPEARFAKACEFKEALQQLLDVTPETDSDAAPGGSGGKSLASVTKNLALA